MISGAELYRDGALLITSDPACAICGDSRIIRLPKRRSVRLGADADAEPTLEEMSATYPCPECSPATPVKIGVVFELQEVLFHEGGPDMMEHGKRHAVRLIGDRMLRDGLIRFEKDELDAAPYSSYGSQKVRATVGVFTPAATRAFEKAVKANEREAAEEVVREAKAQIRKWGSDYDRLEIDKRDAVEFLDEALRVVLKRRRQKWKAVA